MRDELDRWPPTTCTPMPGWNHLWPDSDVELDDDPDEDPEKMPVENHQEKNGVEDQDGAERGVRDGAVVDADPLADEQ